MPCYLKEEGRPHLPSLQLPPRTLQIQGAGLGGLGVDKRELGSWHITHQVVRLSTVPYSLKMVYHLPIAERLQVKKVAQCLGAFGIWRIGTTRLRPKIKGYRSVKKSQRSQIYIDQAGRRHKGSKVKGIRSLIPSP